jgi:triphosphoribosyl-dephospho-CoA synthetase
MHIDWATLGVIAVVAAATALTTVLLVAFALVAMPARSRPAEDGTRAATGTGTAARTRAVGATVAGVCLLSAGLIVSYGLYLIVA